MPGMLAWAAPCLVLAAALAGCVEVPAGDLDAGEPFGAPPPPSAHTTCRLLVSGVGGVVGSSYLRDNECRLTDTGPVNATAPATMAANVTWGSLQPTIAGYVTVALQDTDCPRDEPCVLAQAAGRTSPVRLSAGPDALTGHRLDRLAVFVYPDGIAYEQVMDVAISVQQGPGGPPGNATG